MSLQTLKPELYQEPTEVGFITDFDLDYDANPEAWYTD